MSCSTCSNWVLIYGRWVHLRSGSKAPVWATLISRVVTAVALIGDVTRAPALKEFQPLRWRAKLERVRFGRLLRLGWPVGVQHLLEVSAFIFAALMMGWISADAMAAHQIAITCAATTFMFGLGVGMATCIRVGHAWGASLFSRMRRIGFVGVGLAGAIMAVFGVVFVIGREPIARLFIADPAVVQLAAQLLLIAAIFQVADGVQIGAVSALRGLTDVRVPALIAVLAYWIIAVPLATTLAFAANTGAVGIWIGLATGLGVAAVSLSWRFSQEPGSSSAGNRRALSRRPQASYSIGK